MLKGRTTSWFHFNWKRVTIPTTQMHLGNVIRTIILQTTHSPPMVRNNNIQYPSVIKPRKCKSFLCNAYNGSKLIFKVWFHLKNYGTICWRDFVLKHCYKNQPRSVFNTEVRAQMLVTWSLRRSVSSWYSASCLFHCSTLLLASCSAATNLALLSCRVKSSASKLISHMDLQRSCRKPHRRVWN